MKVIHLISGGDVGGAKTHVLSLLCELNKEMTAHLVSFRRGEFSDDALALGIPTTIIHSGSVFKDYKLLIEIVKSGAYDVIHCHGARGNMMGALLKLGLSIPVVTTVHSDYRLDYLGRPLARLINGTINSVSLRIIDYRIGVSDAMSALLSKRGFPTDRLFTIYNGLNFDYTGDSEFDRELYFKSLGLNIAPDDVVVGIAARLSPVKDLPTLIRAFAIAVERNPQLKLVIAGDGKSKVQLLSLVAELGLEASVFFAGWLEDTDSFYRAIDINTLTSISETFPYALTEGARWKKPAVSSAVGGVPRLIDHGVGGLLFEPGDYNTLSAHLADLSFDAGKRVSMGSRLFSKCVSDFSLEHTRSRQIEIYEDIKGRFERPRKKRDGVVICGAYGRGNAGDDAILESIVCELREIDRYMPIYVMTRRKKETGFAFRVSGIYTFNVFAFLRRMSTTKLYINGGGSLIQDVTSSRSLWFYLFTIAVAKRLGNKVMMYGCGIGPVENARNRRLCAGVLNRNVDIITLREDSSQGELALLGVSEPEIVLSADPTLILKPEPAERIDSVMLSDGVPPQGRYICFALRKWRGFEDKLSVFAECAEYAYSRHSLIPVFLPIERPQDILAAEMVASKLSCPYHLIKSISSAQTAIGILGRMTVLVAMRLHALVFASGQGTPLVGVSYDVKVDAFIKYMRQDLCIPLGNLDSELLKQYIDQLVVRSENRDEMLEAVRTLRTMEYKNVSCARKLLETP